MPDDDVIAWYRTQPLNDAFAAMLHDLRDPFEAFGTINFLLRHFSPQAAACNNLSTTLLQAVTMLVEHDINDELWSVGQAIAQQLPGQQIDEKDLIAVRRWQQPLDQVVIQITQHMRVSVWAICQTIAPLQQSCLASLPIELRENVSSILQNKFDEFLQRIAVLEDIIVPRINAEVLTYR